MRRTMVNLVIDVVSFVVMCAMIATGLVIRFILPPGTGGRHAHGLGGGQIMNLWGMGRHDWGDIHYWLAVVLGILMLIHVVLHWTWICGVIRRIFVANDGASVKPSTRILNLYGLGFLAILLAFFIGFMWVAKNQVETFQEAAGSVDHQQIPEVYPVQDDQHETDDHEEYAIRGSMSLLEVEAATGISAELIRRELGLPEHVSLNERLGRLKRYYEFEISDLRRIIARYQEQANNIEP